jgi:hypothetical protein
MRGQAFRSAAGFFTTLPYAGQEWVERQDESNSVAASTRADTLNSFFIVG